MIRLQRQGLFMALLACISPILCQAQNEYNMDFTFGFFGPELQGVGLPAVDPTDAQLDALMCETQIFLAKVLQESTGNPTVTMEARDIGYVRGCGENGTQFCLTFWGNFSTAPGGSLPTTDDIVAAYDMANNPRFNSTIYITDYASTSNDYWRDIQNMAYDGVFGPPLADGVRKAEAICPETMAPTFPGFNATDPPLDANMTEPPVSNVTDTPPPLDGNVTMPPDDNVTMPPEVVPAVNNVTNGTDTPQPLDGNVTMPPADDNVTMPPVPLDGNVTNGTDAPQPLDGNVTMPPADDNVTMPPAANGTEPPQLDGNVTEPPDGTAGTTGADPDFAGGTFAPGVPTPVPFNNGTFAPEAPTPSPYNNGTFAPGAPTPPPPEFANGTYAPNATTPSPYDGGTFSPGAPTPSPFDNGTFGPGAPTPSPAPTATGAGETTGAPTAMASAPNTEDLVYFTIEYGFPETEAREPTQEEIQEVICRTNLFYRDIIRNFTNDDTMNSEATNIDWQFVSTDFLPAKVSFTANVTSNGYMDPVPLQTVFDAMQVTTPQIEKYIQDYVWEVPEGNVFLDTAAANFTNSANVPFPIGKLASYQCPTTPAPTGAPTISPAPTASASPTTKPTVSASPTTSPMPSPAPTTKATRPPVGPPDGTNTGRPLTPTISSMPTVSAAPTNSPTVSASPTITPVPTLPGGGTLSPAGGRPPSAGGPGVRQQIKVKYYVSNEDDITNSEEIKVRGLSASWPVFSEEVVADISKARNERRLRAVNRRLEVRLEEGTATVDDIQLATCPSGSKKGVTCHSVISSYILLLTGDENATDVENAYGKGTIDAIDDGSYQAVLDEVDDQSPLTIGLIPEPKSSEFPVWAIILIVLLAVLCCCCILAAIFFLMRDRGQEDKALEPYDEEGFVYDFLIPPNEKPQTEVDDDATKAVDVEDEDHEEFNDDEDEDEEEFDEDEDALNKAAPAESIVDIEPDNFESDHEDEEEFENQDESEEEDHEEQPRAVEEDEFDDEDESTPLVAVADEQEAPPSPEASEEQDEEEEPGSPKPDPSEEFDDQEEPGGIRASTLPDFDDEDPASNLEAIDDSDHLDDDEIEQMKLDQETDTLRLEHAEQTNTGMNVEGDDAEDWDDEAPTDSEAVKSGEEDWDDEDEPKAAAAGDDEDWDDDGDDPESEGAADEEWDDDEKEAGGDDEGWEDDGDGGGGDEDDDWDDEDDGKK